MNEQNKTTARLLMQAGGQAGTITGLSLSTVSTMYLMKYMLTAGCLTVEFLPHALNAASEVTMRDHFSQGMNASWGAVFTCAGMTLVGIIVRKLGTMLASESNIRFMESFMYDIKHD